MVSPRSIRRAQLIEQPFLIWNEFLAFLTDAEIEGLIAQLSPVQRTAYLLLSYDAEVQNGGHFQLFANRGINELPDTIQALRQLGGDHIARILDEALSRLPRAIGNRKVGAGQITVAEYTEIEREQAFSDLDGAYYEARPGVSDLLEKYLSSHQDDFVVILD